jgi:homoserine kinase
VSLPTALLTSTEVMRRLLPSELPFKDAVDQVGRVALLVAALLQGRHDLLPTALVDHLHEPHRGPRIPGFEPARAAALEAGALGAVLSGSGPTLLAFAADAAAAARIGSATEAAWRAAGVPAVSRVLPVDLAGARLERLST